ncbi:hypothetical protein LL394_001059 [Serratia marcescens]|uniref:hypothetical protein n=1 Tax=Serratia marcescens TaxID=615 RepID=UPI0007454DEB|nr:hypothetical protein [Serratia marcescens]MDP8619159.1 hypothetical protein [Serratia marcescens]CUY57733.1 Uncharacterised protein [Serratia marcescens]HAT2907005.1 hypothetical protein [Serratia marcescens]HAT3742790.1 hypothetical protein [Serratia marcescens]HAT3801068.1 hypothetical protein [Serratia marcescens]
MKERPVIFNGEMVRAILDGRKTQTRRIAKADNSNHLLGCPFGQVGDRLWVRETFAVLGNEDGCPIDWNGNLIKGDEKQAARIYKASCWQEPGNYGLWSIPDRETQYEGTWRPSIHMPRWASRIMLEITAVRVERLNDISEEDAKAEGVKAGVCPGHEHMMHQVAFSELWQSIYGEESWRANPWVWVIEFKQVSAREVEREA